MSSRDVIEAVVADFDPRSLPEPTPREARLPGLPGKADAVIGMRRVGKSWRVFQEIHRLLVEGAEPDSILYLNFEDERLPDLSADRLQWFVDAHLRRHPEAASRPMALFLDEVQNVPGWEGFVRRHLDRGARVVVTGSSARLLAREIATSLRGRSMATELSPFSFREALVHAGQALPEVWPPPEADRVRLRAAFDVYLRTGGFPEVQGLAERDRVRVLQDYVDVVVLRDVIDRHGVGNVEALRYLVRRLLEAPAGRMSLNRIYNDLRSQGRRVGKDLLYDSLAHLQDAFLVHALPIDSASEAVRSSNPRKVYPSDAGLAVAHSFTAARNTGHLLETVVYLELRRRGFTCAWVRTASGFEVDFVARRRGVGDEALVQVSADVSDRDTLERELRALQEAMAERGLASAQLITLDTTDSWRVGSGEVRALPAWRWLLEPVGA